MAKKEVTAYFQKIAELGGTMPENLPTPEKSAKALKKERLKGVTKKSLVYLFFSNSVLCLDLFIYPLQFPCCIITPFFINREITLLHDNSCRPVNLSFQRIISKMRFL